ncbi:OmpH family outer membrane protein [Psychroflexus planctonicus]|uniref:OmpH family outer membrane protein n=1 Tax=Psychroflexus planctonicus TaxID=1526575 RepID=UPI001E656B3B|nr:OmpH family outer membrane protein [Psychroflexus planctonicus]
MKSINFKYGLLIGIMSFIFTSCDQEKTAYVNNTELIQAYEKMKSAKAEFEQRNEKLSQELDSIALDFQSQIQSYQQNADKMRIEEREKEEDRLIALRQKIEKEQQQKSQKLERESQDAADVLVKEVRKKVEKYGEENGYTYIFGSNDSANILYAKRGKDITLEVIEYINE